MLVSMCECAYLLHWWQIVETTGNECLQLAQISKVYHLVGNAMVKLDKYKEAYAYLESAHRLDPSAEISNDFTAVVDKLNES
jgi:hypothetical protein